MSALSNLVPDRLPRPGRGAFAVWRRNTRVWQKLIRVSLILNFGEPLIYLLGFGFGFGAMIDDLQGMSYLTFLASGLIVSSVMSSSSFEAMYSVFTRMEPQRTYASMLATPLSVDDIVAGELLWCATKGLISGVAILLVGFALGALQGPGALLVIPLLMLAGLAFASLAILITPFAPGYDYFNYYYTLVLVPMFLCSGVYFPLDNLPAAVQWVAMALPLYHAVELVRPLVTGAWPGDVVLHLSVMLAYIVFGFVVSTHWFRRRLLV